MFDWDAFLVRLSAHPPTCHELLPPCPMERIQAVEAELGTLPGELAEVLKHFNGAKLFIDGGPLVRFFGISMDPPLPPLEWAPEWCIDAFTPQWRAAGSNRQRDWAIAMMNYGGLILLDTNGAIKEWDTGTSCWLSTNVSLKQFLERLMEEGEAIVEELRGR